MKRDGEKLSLIVDGISAQSRRIPTGVRTHLSGPLCVGGVPASLMVKHPDQTIRGSVTRWKNFLKMELKLH